MNYWLLRSFNPNRHYLEFMYSPTKTSDTGSSCMTLDNVGNLVISGKLIVNGSFIKPVKIKDVPKQRLETRRKYKTKE